MEAGKDFVDLLFSFLLLPTGTTIRLLADAGYRNAINNVYVSAQNLKESVFTDDKRILFKFQPANGLRRSALLLETSSGAEASHRNIYKCNCSVDSLLRTLFIVQSVNEKPARR